MLKSQNLVAPFVDFRTSVRVKISVGTRLGTMLINAETDLIWCTSNLFRSPEMWRKCDHSGSNMSITTVADTCVLGVDQGLGVRRYDRLDDTPLTNVDNSEREPGESHDQQRLALIWVTGSQGPQKWAAVTSPVGTRECLGRNSWCSCLCCATFFFVLFYCCIPAASSAFTTFQKKKKKKSDVI